MRVRIRFAKMGKVRWTSHRDLARMWERGLRRAAVPVAMTEGFSPRPKLSFGLALPTGGESLGEYLDAELLDGERLDLAVLPSRLSPELPDGIDCQLAVEVDPREPSLQQDVVACGWEISVVGDDGGLTDGDAVDRAVALALAAPTLVVTRSRKGHSVTDDIRPAIRTLHRSGTSEDGAAVLTTELATQPRGVRPGELIAACLPTAEVRRVVRTHQWIERDGARREPIPVDATSPAHALLACARA